MLVQPLISLRQFSRMVRGATTRKRAGMPPIVRMHSRTAVACSVFPRPIYKHMRVYLKLNAVEILEATSSWPVPFHEFWSVHTHRSFVNHQSQWCAWNRFRTIQVHTHKQVVLWDKGCKINMCDKNSANLRLTLRLNTGWVKCLITTKFTVAGFACLFQNITKKHWYVLLGGILGEHTRYAQELSANMRFMFDMRCPLWLSADKRTTQKPHCRVLPKKYPVAPVACISCTKDNVAMVLES